MKDARVSYEGGEAWVQYDDQEVSVARLREVINGTGFTAVEEGSKQGNNPIPIKMDGSNEATSRRYSKDLNELRAKFNGDKGKVRLLMLLSPT